MGGEGLRVRQNQIYDHFSQRERRNRTRDVDGLQLLLYILLQVVGADFEQAVRNEIILNLYLSSPFSVSWMAFLINHVIQFLIPFSSSSCDSGFPRRISPPLCNNYPRFFLPFFLQRNLPQVLSNPFDFLLRSKASHSTICTPVSLRRLLQLARHKCIFCGWLMFIRSIRIDWWGWSVLHRPTSAAAAAAELLV